MISQLGKPMTVNEVAKAIGMSTDYVYRHHRELGGVKMGRAIRFFEHKVLERLYAIQEEEPAQGRMELVRESNTSKRETENKEVRKQAGSPRMGSIDQGEIEELAGPDRHNLITNTF